MTDDERIFYAARIQSMMDSDGKLPHGALSILAKQAGRDRATMGRLKGRVQKNGLKDLTKVISHKKRSGRKLKYSVKDLQTRIKKIPLMSRKTIRSTAHGVRIPKTTFHRYAKKHGLVIHHSS